MRLAETVALTAASFRAQRSLVGLPSMRLAETVALTAASFRAQRSISLEKLTIE
jgi:hypothetical protein